jgi:hypothetical protein
VSLRHGALSEPSELAEEPGDGEREAARSEVMDESGIQENLFLAGLPSVGILDVCIVELEKCREGATASGALNLEAPKTTKGLFGMNGTRDCWGLRVRVPSALVPGPKIRGSCCGAVAVSKRSLSPLVDEGGAGV